MLASRLRWAVLAAVPLLTWSVSADASPTAAPAVAPAPHVAPSAKAPAAPAPHAAPSLLEARAKALAPKLGAEDVARLSPLLQQNPAGANQLLRDHGTHVARVVRSAPLHTLDDLEAGVLRQAKRVEAPVVGLYDSVLAEPVPQGWDAVKPAVDRRGKPTWTKRTYEGPRTRNGERIRLVESYRVDEDGTRHVTAAGHLPERAPSQFETSYDPKKGVVKYASTFLGELDPWVENTVDLRAGSPGSGIPTSMAAGLGQLRVLGVPFGKDAAHGGLREAVVSRIFNFETIVHLHWLRKQYPGEPVEKLLESTDSVTFTDSQLRQAGYEVVGVTKITNNDQNPNGKHVGAIQEAMSWYEAERETAVAAVRGPAAGKAARAELRQVHDALLARYGFTRRTWMYWDFDIHLELRPVTPAAALPRAS